MKISKIPGLVLLLVLVGSLLTGCRNPAPTNSQSRNELSELSETSWLQMVMRYLYRWQLDESEFEAMLKHHEVVFWIRPLHPKLDPGDHSQFAEVLLPQLDMTLLVKKADYRIAETGTLVQSQHFKIIRVTDGEVPKHRLRECTVVTMDTEEVRDFLFKTRFQRDTFDPVIVEHLRQAAQEQAAKEGLLTTNILNGQQLISIAPNSPAANETWVLWEIRRKLFYISSDIDLADPAVWKYQTLKMRTFDLDQQVVISHEEATGSNFYMTRHQVGRVLFNCIVLGQRIDLPPASSTNSAPVPGR